DAARSIRAKAFTHGSDIWLGAGQHSEDVALLAHEATHVVQQSEHPGAPALLQRAPADYQHPEDGGAVAGRMEKAIEDELGDDAPAATATLKAPVRPDQPAPGAPPTPPPAPPPEARRKVDRSELATKRSELEPGAKPDVDRPAAEQPRVEAAGSSTKSEADLPSRPIAEAKGAAKEPAKGKKGAAESAAEAAAAQADAAFAAAAAQPQPDVAAPVTPPKIVEPVDAKGTPLIGDPAADQHVLELAAQAQELRQRGYGVRQHATEDRQNAETLRGNLALVRSNVAQAEEGVKKSNDHLAFRQDLAGKAHKGLDISEEKAAKVAAGAPGYSAKADEGKAESGPMAAEAADSVAQNASNTPDDEEAAEKAQEQGGKMNKAASDIGSTDDTITKTQAKSQTLAQDAKEAAKQNTQTQSKLEGVDKTLTGTGDRLEEMTVQNRVARQQVEALLGAPDRLLAEAQMLDEQGLDLVATSFAVESRLTQTQARYETGMRGVPAPKLQGPGDQSIGSSSSAASVPEGTIQRQVDLTAPAPEAEAWGSPAGPDQAGAGEELSDQETGGPVATESPGGLPPGRVDLDLTGKVNRALPSWLTGTPEVKDKDREEAIAAENKHRSDNLTFIDDQAKEGFDKLSATDKVGIALRLTGRNLFGKASGIKWPGWGHLAAGLIDPRSSLMGVVSGLSMMVSGVANLLSGEQWKKDPLGNLLKSAADVATGLTIILGSITALAGVIIAIMTALTILSFGTLAAVTGPVIAFCTTVLTTVGGWTIAVGKVALVLQALVFIKDLIDAACAQTAQELSKQSDKLTEDAGNAGNVVMQMGMAKLGQVGGKAAAAEISEAGGGVAYAARMGAKPWGSVAGGARGLAAEARAAGGGFRGAYRATGSMLGRGARGVGQGIKSTTIAGWKGLKSVTGRATTGLRSVPGRIARGLRALPGEAVGALRGLPGRVAGGVRALPGRALEGAKGFIKGARGLPEHWAAYKSEFLFGEGVTSLKSARAVAGAARKEGFLEGFTAGYRGARGWAEPTSMGELAPEAESLEASGGKGAIDETPPPPVAEPAAVTPPRSAHEVQSYLEQHGLEPSEILGFAAEDASRLGAKQAAQVERLAQTFPPQDLKALGKFLFDNEAVLTKKMVDDLLETFPSGGLAEAIQRGHIREVFGAEAGGGIMSGEQREFAPGTTIHEGRLPSPREIRPTPGNEALRASMLKEGPPPPPGYHAHHIIPDKEFGESMEWLRERLRAADGNINGAENGVWLAGSRSTANPELTRLHNSYIHAGKQAEYAYTLTARLGDKEGAALLEELDAIRAEMAGGSFKTLDIPYGWKTKWKPGMALPTARGKHPGFMEE
ncbi:MAG: DUF4157 domain-containing protein, partial [Gemmatimonadales bacterium]